MTTSSAEIIKLVNNCHQVMLYLSLATEMEQDAKRPISKLLISRVVLLLYFIKTWSYKN